MIDMSDGNITILDTPIESDWATWILNHPDCDTICEDVIIGKLIKVFAFSNSKKGNEELKQYRNTKLSGKKIIKGLSKNAINGII